MDKIAVMVDEQKCKDVVKSPYRAKCIQIEKSTLAKIDLRIGKIQQHFNNATRRLDEAFIREQALVGEISIVQGEIYDLAYKVYIGLVVDSDAKFKAFNLEDRIFVLTQKLERLRSNLKKRRLYRINNLQTVDRTESDLAYEQERSSIRKDKAGAKSSEPISDATTISDVPDHAIAEIFKQIMQQRLKGDTDASINPADSTDIQTSTELQNPSTQADIG